MSNINQPDTDTPEVTSRWDSDWGGGRHQSTTPKAAGTADIEEEGPGSTDPANADEEPEELDGDAPPVKPQDRGCWTIYGSPGNTPRSGW